MKNELFTMEPNFEPVPKEQERKALKRRTNRPAAPALLYSSCSLQELMEFFEWGFVFPSGYLLELLSAQDISMRFPTIEERYFIPFHKERYVVRPGHYHLEWDHRQLVEFLEIGQEVIHGLLPIPVHLIKRIYCSAEEDRRVFDRLWSRTDNDPIEIVQAPLERQEPLTTCTIEVTQSKRDQVRSAILHLDQCLGAICFTKGLEPFIRIGLQDPCGNGLKKAGTFSRNFVGILQEWAPEKQKKQLSPSIEGEPEGIQKYLDFIERMIDQDWTTDAKNGSLLKALKEHRTGEELHEALLQLVRDQGGPVLGEKVQRTSKGLSYGTVNLREALQDPELRRPNILFLLLLRLYHRKGKIETDAHAFRSTLLDRGIVGNGGHIEFLGTLYGFYIGYHGLRKYESLNELAGIPLKSPELHPIFRQKLSTTDPFECFAFDTLYNRIARNTKGLPQVTVELRPTKEKGTSFALETGSPDVRKKLTFTPVPTLGKHGYEITISTGPNRIIQSLMDGLSAISSQKGKKVASHFLISDLLQVHGIKANIAKNVNFLFKEGQLRLDLDIDLPELRTRLQGHLDHSKEGTAFLTDIQRLSELIKSIHF
ncbi:MAG TPA: hypothetical protein VHK69_03910 [Chitinophagaceae bacterium]|nr:hypothetical protein [Chitinophagaceae bacterium]